MLRPANSKVDQSLTLCCPQAMRAKHLREGSWQAHAGLQRPGLRMLAVLAADLLLSMPGYAEDLQLIAAEVCTTAFFRP